MHSSSHFGVCALALCLGASLLAGPLGAQSAVAAEKPKALMLFSYLGDQSYVRQYNIAKGRAANLSDVQIEVKAGTTRGDVNFFIQEIVNAPGEGYAVIAVNTGASSKELVAALNAVTKQGVKVMSFDGAPPPIDNLTAQVNYDPVGAEKEVVAEFVKELRRFLRMSLPDYVIPQVFEVLEALPQLSSGKVNRAALPAVAPAARPVHRYVAPRTDVERELAAIWADLLRLERVGAYDNFFELGGHSLLAVQLLSRVRHIYDVELSLEVVYSGEFTVAELAKAVELKETEQAGGNYRELLQELEALSDEEVRALLAEERDS